MIHHLFFFKKKFRLAFIIVFILSGFLACNSVKVTHKTDSKSNATYPNNSVTSLDIPLPFAPSEDSIGNRNDSPIFSPSSDSPKENTDSENPGRTPVNNISKSRKRIPKESNGSKSLVGVSKGNTGSESPGWIPKKNTVSGSPTLIPKEEVEELVVIKGTALVYCPVSMIRNIPTIINAAVSKDELSKAMDHFTGIVQEKNPELKTDKISGNMKSTGINIYEQMGVVLVFDRDDFKEISSPEDTVKSFKNTNSLEWEWQLKPLQSTRKSIISFKFYYTDPVNNKKEFILEKTINIAVRVDPRDYVEKWEDFILDDPKNTITVIIIPLFTFLGGFLTGKKNKKAV